MINEFGFVAIGSEDHHATVRGDRRARENELVQLGWIIAQAITIQVDRRIILIVKFDPIVLVTIVIRQTGAVGRTDFIDNHLCFSKSRNGQGNNQENTKSLFA